MTGPYRYVCDRAGGTYSIRRKPWTCPRCGEERERNGHRCQDCRRRVCCQCFHHDIGICLSGGGSDVKPTVAQIERCPGVAA